MVTSPQLLLIVVVYCDFCLKLQGVADSSCLRSRLTLIVSIIIRICINMNIYIYMNMDIHRYIYTVKDNILTFCAKRYLKQVEVGDGALRPLPPHQFVVHDANVLRAAPWP